MKRLTCFLVLALLVIAGCKQIPKRPAPKPPAPPPLPSGMSFKKLTAIGDTGTGNGVELTYVPTDFAITSIRIQQNNVVLMWQNGTPPFQPQSKPDVLSGWVDYGPSTLNRSVTNPAPYAFTKGFFRIRGGPQQPDLSPPSVNLTAPANGSTVSNVITITANATDDVGVTMVEFFLDGGVLVGSDATAPYSLAWDSATVPNGTHFLRAKAHDASGKSADSAFVVITVSNFSPYTGTCIWSKRFGGTSGKFGLPRDIVNPVRIATGADNSIVVAGYYLGRVNMGGITLTNAGASEIFIAKYAADGTHVWSKRFGGIVNDQAQAVAIDSRNGDIVVLGEFGSVVDFGGTILTAVGANSDIFLLRMSPDGTVQWAKRFGNSTGESARGVAVDSTGAAVITGYFDGTVDFGGGGLTSAGLGDVVLAKFSTTGNHVWSKLIGGTAQEASAGISIDGTGNIAVTGTTAGTVNFGGGPLTANGTDIFIAKYNAAGAFVWATLYGGPNTQRPVSISMNSTGAIALAGNFLGTVNFGNGTMTNSGEQDIFVARLGPTGIGAWSRAIGFPDDTTPTFTAADVSFDRDGNVLLAGSILTGSNSWEGLIRKFSITGADLWEKRISSIGNDGANSVTVDSANATIVCGFFYETVNLGCGALSALGFTDELLLKLSP